MITATSVMATSWRAVLWLLLTLLVGCAYFGEEEPARPEKDSLDVVSDRGPFDPAAAVDDDDRNDRARPEPSEVDEARRAVEGENVATPREVRRKQEAREKAVRQTTDGGDEEAEKVELAENPAPKDPGEGKSLLVATIDLTLDILLMALLALVPVIIIAMIRRRWRIVLTSASAIVVGGVILVAMVAWQG